MKRIVPLIVVLFCLAAAPAALARSVVQCDPGDGGGTPGFGLIGSVTAVDATGGVLTVAVEHGSDGVPATVNVDVTADTQLFSVRHHERTEIALADVVVGSDVIVYGSTDDSSDDVVYTADVICVRAPSFRLFGTVTAVDTAGSVLTVAVDQASDGLSGSVDVHVTDDTRLMTVSLHRHACDETEISLADVAVGDKVGVCGTIDTSTETPVYTADVVRVRVPAFGLVGTVTAVDTTGGVLTVAVDHGSQGVSGTVDVAVADDTELLAVKDHERSAITLADIAVGDEVAAFGTIDESATVYTANVVLDGVSADWLPRPLCKPHAVRVRARDAGKGDTLRVAVRVADAMPGCTSAKVTLTIVTARGAKVAVAVRAVAVNQQVKVPLKLAKALRRGQYRVVAKSTDWAGNRQAKAASAVLTVK